MSEKFSLKDHLFNREKVIYLASLIKSAYPKFEDKKFIKKTVEKFPELELKQRIDWIEQKIEEFLPFEYEKTLEIILNALPDELDPNKTDDDFGDFILAPFQVFIVKNGLSKKHLKKSLRALGECTKRFTVEGGIRYFINAFPDETISQIKKWSTSKNYHQRRLASEGIRPTLPWHINIDFDYREGIDILYMLFADKTRYVTRSVANHMNDISKIDSKLVLKTLALWKISQKQNEKEMDFIIRHSLRTLLKQGNKQALAMLGYKKPAQISVKFGKISKTVKLGEKLEFNFNVKSHADQKLMISYYVYFLNKKNEFIPKIFQIKKCDVRKGDVLELSKKHMLKIMSTKKLYPGKQAIQVIVNGLAVTDKIFFILTK